MATISKFSPKASSKALPGLVPSRAVCYRRSTLTRAPRKRTFVMVEMTRYTLHDFTGASREGVCTAAAVDLFASTTSGCPPSGGDNGGRRTGGNGDSNTGGEGPRSPLASIPLLGPIALALGAAVALSMALPQPICASPMPRSRHACASKASLCLSLDSRTAAAIDAKAQAAAARGEDAIVYGHCNLSTWEQRMLRKDGMREEGREYVRVGF